MALSPGRRVATVILCIGSAALPAGAQTVVYGGPAELPLMDAQQLPCALASFAEPSRAT